MTTSHNNFVLAHDISNEAQCNYQVVFKNSCPLISVTRIVYLICKRNREISWSAFPVSAVEAICNHWTCLIVKIYRAIIGIR